MDQPRQTVSYGRLHAVSYQQNDQFKSRDILAASGLKVYPSGRWVKHNALFCRATCHGWIYRILSSRC